MGRKGNDSKQKVREGKKKEEGNGMERTKKAGKKTEGNERNQTGRNACVEW